MDRVGRKKKVLRVLKITGDGRGAGFREESREGETRSRREREEQNLERH